MNLALACDVRLAGASARFDTRFLKIGLHPGGGHMWMLERAVGPQSAAAMVLFGARVDGARAAEIGLAWACHPDDELLERAVAVAAARGRRARCAARPGPGDAAPGSLAARLRSRDRDRGRPSGLVARAGLVRVAAFLPLTASDPIGLISIANPARNQPQGRGARQVETFRCPHLPGRPA